MCKPKAALGEESFTNPQVWNLDNESLLTCLDSQARAKGAPWTCCYWQSKDWEIFKGKLGVWSMKKKVVFSHLQIIAAIILICGFQHMCWICYALDGHQ